MVETRKPRVRQGLDDDAFTRLWNESRSAEQVAYILGCPVDSARQRASLLRENGYTLRSMRKPGHDFTEVTNLARLEHGDAWEPTPREFVLLWQLCNSHQQIAQITGMSLPAIRSRGRFYRSGGVPLKRYQRGREPAKPVS